MSATPKLTPTKNAAGAHWLGRLVRRVFCRHALAWVKNIHGDEINATGSRTVWICEKCGKYLYARDYITKDMACVVYDPTNDEPMRGETGMNLK